MGLTLAAHRAQMHHLVLRPTQTVAARVGLITLFTVSLLKGYLMCVEEGKYGSVDEDCHLERQFDSEP